MTMIDHEGTQNDLVVTWSHEQSYFALSDQKKVV